MTTNRLREALIEARKAIVRMFADVAMNGSACGWAQRATEAIFDTLAATQDAGTTHYVGCYDSGPRHYDCALAEIERLKAQDAQRRGDADEDIRLDGYYIHFSRTGNKMIDRILSAVAMAGKAFHNTSEWNEDCSPYEDIHRGKTPMEWIQNAANDAAAQLSGDYVMVPSGWQPIETAPRDGTTIIVHGGMAYWRVGSEAWFTITGAEWPGKPIQWEVTHWMPFPAPPGGKGEDSARETFNAQDDAAWGSPAVIKPFTAEELDPEKAMCDCRWRKIETAPRDGTNVLCSNLTSKLIYVGAYRQGRYDEPGSGVESNWRAVCCGRFATPTHWMPLPAPPGGKGEG